MSNMLERTYPEVIKKTSESAVANIDVCRGRIVIGEETHTVVGFPDGSVALYRWGSDPSAAQNIYVGSVEGAIELVKENNNA